MVVQMDTKSNQGGNGTIIPIVKLTNITSDDSISVPLTLHQSTSSWPNLDYTNIGNPDEMN